MSKHVFIVFFLFFDLVFIGDIHSAALPATESLNEVLKMPENKRDKQLVRLFYNRYRYSPTYDDYLPQTLDSLKRRNIKGVTGLGYLARTLILRRNLEYNRAEQLLYEAIAWAQKEDNSYLLYNFYLNLAFTKTDKKDELNAIHSFRFARREAVRLNDKMLLASTDLGIANVYAVLQLFDQALFYLNLVSNTNATKDSSYKKFIFYSYLSKAGVFFYKNQADSLALYTQKAAQLNKDIYYAQKEFERLHYYELMLTGKYKEAAPAIESLLKTEISYRQIDNINLATCLFKTGNYGKADSLARALVADSTKVASHIKIEAYSLLVEMARRIGNDKKVLAYQAAALSESEKYNKNITGIADLSSQIRLDQMDTFYQTQTSIYKKERVLLLFTLLAVALSALVIAIFYHGIRQKRRYEKLLQESRDKELTFLNSHRTRKHLANILGFCTLVQATGPDEKELLLYFDHVAEAATEMDEWLKEVNERLTAEK